MEAERPGPLQVELALMVARPGVRFGAHPALILAREVRALRADAERWREAYELLHQWVSAYDETHAELQRVRAQLEWSRAHECRCWAVP